jgi:hypothetical protein
MNGSARRSIEARRTNWHPTKTHHTTNIEDGIALADEPLRRSFKEKYPDAWRRIQQRRTFMRDVLGIRLKEEVLPFSNIPAYLPPYWLSPRQAMRIGV